MPLRKLASIERDEFTRAHLRPRTPLALEASARTIPAVGTWDIDFFATHYGSHRVPIDGIHSGREETLNAYISHMRSPGDFDEAPSYMRNFLLFERFPELRADFEMPWFASPNWLQSKVLGDFSGGSWRYWVELFLSREGTRFPFVHIDPYYTHAWSLQLSGRKRFWLWAPLKNQFERVYDGTLPRENPKIISPSTSLESFHPERPAHSVVLHPGEMLFLPAGWWHTTETLEESVTLGGNFVEASNWHDFRRLYHARNPTHSLGQLVQRHLASAAAPVFFRCRQAAESMLRSGGGTLATLQQPERPCDRSRQQSESTERKPYRE